MKPHSIALVLAAVTACHTHDQGWSQREITEIIEPHTADFSKVISWEEIVKSTARGASEMKSSRYSAPSGDNIDSLTQLNQFIIGSQNNDPERVVQLGRPEASCILSIQETTKILKGVRFYRVKEPAINFDEEPYQLWIDGPQGDIYVGNIFVRVEDTYYAPNKNILKHLHPVKCKMHSNGH